MRIFNLFPSTPRDLTCIPVCIGTCGYVLTHVPTVKPASHGHRKSPEGGLFAPFYPFFNRACFAPSIEPRLTIN